MAKVRRRNQRAARTRAADPDAGGLAAREPADLHLQDVRYRKARGIARIEIHRPQALNAYTTSTLVELATALRDASFDDHIGVIVLTGSGPRAFCTGGDVKEYADRFTRRPRDYWKYMGHFQNAVESLLRSGKPTIARLNGLTIGGGNELHLACDLSVAAAHASIGQVGVGVGSVACGGATQWLPLTIGDRRARAMLLLNERIPAPRALDWGLVSEVAPSVERDGRFVNEPTPEEIGQALAGSAGYRIDLKPLDAAVDALAERLLRMFPECLRYTKQQTNFWKELAWSSTIGQGRDWLALHFALREPQEGMSAFVEKRPARVDLLRRDIARGGGDYPHGPPTRRCAKCGTALLAAGFAFCGRCGARLDAAPAEAR